MTTQLSASILGIEHLGDERVLVGLMARKISLFGHSFKISIYRDITAGKNTIELFRMSKFALDNAMEMVLWINRSGLIVYSNQVTEHVLGYPKAELLNLNIKDVDATYSVTLDSNTTFTSTKRNESLLKESSFKKKSGDFFPVELSSVVNNNNAYTCIFARDISKRKALDKTLSDLECFHRAVFETTSNPTVIVDGNTNILRVNRAFELLTGFNKQAVEGIKSWTEFVSKNDIDRLLGFHYLRKEHPELCPDKHLFDIVDANGNLKNIYMTINKITGIEEFFCVASWLDITELRKTESELRLSYTQLEERVALRTIELNKTKLELEEHINKRIVSTRALIHDLKTNLTPMITASELFENCAKTEPLISLSRNITSGVKGLEKRINDLLDLARSEIGIFVIKPTWTNPTQFVKEIFNYLEPEVKRHSINFVLECPDSVPVAWVDEEQLSRVVINLISNAIKYTKRSGTITLRLFHNDQELIFEVQDTGCGISSTYIKDIFKLYHRYNTSGESGEGLGLGLYLSKVIVELHGGQIEVRSALNIGSTFIIKIPLTEGMC